MENKIVVVGMSGGVDSSVAAYLLKEQGYTVIGATMKLIDDDITNQSIVDAKEICDNLGVEHHVFDLVKEFKEIVIDDFISNYKSGNTPNPCVVCNKHFKFGLFYDKAVELGASYIATGHYAKINHGKLQRVDSPKDQTYFLYGIRKEILNHILFPLENYLSKDEIRKIAENAFLSTKNKKDSQEICFIPNDDYKAFLVANKDIKISKGDICLKDGTILGQHNGIINYTIGQRKGLNISYKEPLYVIEIDVINNKIIVGSNNDLFNIGLIASNVNFLVDDIKLKVFAKVRSRGTLQPATIRLLDNNEVEVIFKEPQRAITKGQSVVFYDENDICIGGGIITQII